MSILSYAFKESTFRKRPCLGNVSSIGRKHFWKKACWTSVTRKNNCLTIDYFLWEHFPLDCCQQFWGKMFSHQPFRTSLASAVLSCFLHYFNIQKRTKILTKHNLDKSPNFWLKPMNLKGNKFWDINWCLEGTLCGEVSFQLSQIDFLVAQINLKKTTIKIFHK